jgi:hypothetical protein
MSDAVPRLCLNEAGAVAANTLLTVRLQEVPAGQRKAFTVAFYNSATLLSCERTGRSYGGGVLKLEPSEADRVLVPSMRLVREQREALSGLGQLVRRGLAEGGAEMLQAIREVDRVLLGAAGIEPDEATQLAVIRERAVERRRTRARRRREPSPELNGRSGAS